MRYYFSYSWTKLHLDQVLRVSRQKIPVPIKEEEEELNEDNADNDGDVDMIDDTIPKPKPKKRREKKVVPVGRNGLKKKRVMKSRMTVDAKGYMGLFYLIRNFCRRIERFTCSVTEDYSSYESADESEAPEPAAPIKEKVKSRSQAKAGEAESSGGTPPAAKSKPSRRPQATKAGKSNLGPKNVQPKQKNLKTFFSAPAKGKG